MGVLSDYQQTFLAFSGQSTTKQNQYKKLNKSIQFLMTASSKINFL
jgi:hypothetical protein